MLSEKQKIWKRDGGVMEAKIEEFVGPDLWRKLRSYIGNEVQVNDGLIATRVAQNDPLLIQGDLDSIEDAPVGYGLAGFWGYGINSYAFYFQTVTDYRRLFVRLPYGGMFMDDARCHVNIREYLSALLEYVSLDLRSYETFAAFESMGWGYYRLETQMGDVYELRDSLGDAKDLRERLRGIALKDNLVINDTPKSAIWANVAFWDDMKQQAGDQHMAQRFVDDDASYRAWVEHNPAGFVLNTERVAKSGYLILHIADCSHITRFVGANPTSTDMGKTCGTTTVELMRWAAQETGGEPRACRVCDPLMQRATTWQN